MSIPLHVLILEDRKTDLEMVLHELRRAGFDPRYSHAADEKEFLSRLNPDLDVILADYSLPQFNALEALKLLQERGMHTPFIVVTGSISEEAAVSCLKSGATDYLLKDRLARLGSAITQALEARKNLEAKLAAEEEIRRRNRELVLLNRIIAVSAENPDERVFLKIACDELARAIGPVRVAAILREGDRQSVAVVAESGVRKGEPYLTALPPAQAASLAAAILSLPAPLILNEEKTDPRVFQAHQAFMPGGVGALALFPLHVERTSAGALALAAPDPGHFNEERVELVKSVADQLSSGLTRVVLERERRRLSAAVEQASDAIIIVDAQHTIRYVNPAYERITGYSRSEMSGRPAQFLAGGRQEHDFGKILGAMAQDGKEWRGRLINRKKNGALYTVDMSLAPIRDTSGAVSNYVGVQRDVTEELALEERFRQAHKMEAVGRLAGGVAHDFNNLLTAIMGYANILAGRFSANSQEQADVAEIRRAAERAANLTKQLLTFSRKQVFQPQILSLNIVVRDMERMLQPVIGEDVELVTDLDPRLGPVKADPGQIEQVIMNLAINARDAMPSGGKIVLRTRNEEVDARQDWDRPGLERGSYVTLSVSDTGTGLSEEVLAHLFEPFFTTKEEGKGTGLGLATVYGIVKQSGGYIFAASEPGKGTAFTIFLPRLAGKTVSEESDESRASLPRGTESILLVEDNTMVNDLIHKVLKGQGYRVTVSAHPQEALDLSAALTRPIDLLITDMVMPGMGGLELAAKIKASFPAVKVLLISGYADPASINEGKAEPGTAFLQKPFSPRSLVQAVRGVLDA